MFVSSATVTGDEPPQKRVKTACAADVDIVEKVCFLCAITNMILNFNVQTAGNRLLWTADHDT
jgi:hypothetical protein